MANELLVLVPTRGRPSNAAYLIDAWRANTGTYADLMFVCDDDDPEIDGYRAMVPRHNLTVGKRERLGPTLNRESMAWCQAYEAIGFLGDDHRPRTHSWDALVMEALRQPGINVCYGDDLVQRERLPTAVFMRGHLIEVLGYMCPPHQIHLFLDDFWLVLGRAVGVTYLPDVVIEHVHPVANKAEWDAGYREVNSKPMWDHDQTAFDAYMRHTWQPELERLRALGF